MDVSETDAVDVEGSLSLDAGDNEEFTSLQAGERCCFAVWGTLESNKDGALTLAVDKGLVMPQDYGDEGDEEGTEEEPSPATAAVSRTTVKPPGEVPKSVISVMVGRPKA